MSAKITTVAVGLVLSSSPEKVSSLVQLPRSMTVAELQKIAPRGATFSVDGYAPAGTTTLGDLYDVCATKGEEDEAHTLRILVRSAPRFGVMLACPGCCISTGNERLDIKGPVEGITGAVSDIVNGAAGFVDNTINGGPAPDTSNNGTTNGATTR